MAIANWRGGVPVLAAVVLIGSVAGFGIARTAPTDPPVVAALDRLVDQRLEWGSCESDLLDGVGAHCANMTVPLDYSEPQGRTISVAISRVQATDPSHRRGILLSNPGGPGGRGLDLPVRLGRAAPSYPWGLYDLIGFDPRGVGRSTPIHCGWSIGDSFQSAGADPAGFGESVSTQADLAARCLAADSGMLPHITTRNTARDIDLIRRLLGEERINYFGMSYGTYLGAVYTQMFPERTDRMVLDSAVDPARYGPDVMIQDQGPPLEEALDALADWTAARADRYRLGTTRTDVRAVVSGLIEQAARQPIRVGAYDVDEHWLPSVLFGYLHDSRRFDDAANAVRQLADAAAGQLAEPSADLEQALSGLLTATTDDAVASVESSTAVVCGDVSAPRDPAWYWRNVEASLADQPIFGPLVNNISPCAFWPEPVEPHTDVHNGTPVLIVQATGDPVAAYREGVGLHRTMTASRLVTLQDVIVHGAFTVPSSCVSQAVETYLRDGALPATDLTCHAD
ncbi:alpha/beta fold hydrolase [Nocardia sp. SYP-A9097]|uniref:alpha/beta hydrolase n=1 Tax=Nocardia sp. SYP-A9097 TaxID=2663237 RepID=UPI00129B1A4E|nr:alpha/beta hydrolase [Nocardia sp. SYP-A9097]MRH87439.1 alpha/beta fold hydrolase [Nocardia sp. SYP-A9097]